MIITRSDISHAVNQCSHYMTKETKAHYEVLKNILRYLAGVKHFCDSHGAPLQRHWKKGCKLQTHIYSFADTSWSDDKNSRKSTCCYLIRA
jgi:hypothetical protein